MRWRVKKGKNKEISEDMNKSQNYTNNEDDDDDNNNKEER